MFARPADRFRSVPQLLKKSHKKRDVLPVRVHHPEEIHKGCEPVRPGEHDDLLELLSRVGLALGAQQDLAAPGADGAAWAVQRGAPHRGGHLAEGEAVASQ